MSCVEYPLLLLPPDVRPLPVMHGPEGYFTLLISVSATCTLWRHRCACCVVVRCPPGGVHTEQLKTLKKKTSFLHCAVILFLLCLR